MAAANPISSTYTRVGSIRAGLDYQDIVALDLVVEMLEHPDRYQWIQVEGDEAGYLDDVTALCYDGSLVARQVKFSTDPSSPDDAWTWETLLKEKQGERRLLPSLLAKWNKSLDQLSALGPLGEAALVSNRNASSELKGALSVAGLVDFDKISAPERTEIIRQLGSEDAAHSFFAQFHFYIDKPNLDEMEAAVLKRFWALGGTEYGWLALKNEMRVWARDRTQPSPDGKITLVAARRAAQWYSLQSLPQRFEVPPDYVLPSQGFYDQLVTDLTKVGSGCIVLDAPPGLGKSTFLSHLVHQLRERDVPVIRHHYFLSLTDRSGDRFSHLKVAESLMSDLQKDFPEALGEDGKRNPNPHELGKWLEVCGRFFLSQGKALTVIIDGLDHVFRENRSIDELNKLFQYLLPPPEGVFILVGTQPVEDNQLPPSLLRAASRPQWRSLPSLDRLAVRHWLEHHTQEIGTAMAANFQEHVLEELTGAFFTKSQGHPLHLRYSLRALIEQGLAVTSPNVALLPGCTHQEIESYYGELWRALPESGRQILHLLAACRFTWPQPGIVNTLDPRAERLADIHDALRKVAHLTVSNELGVRPFHTSLLVYVQSQPEHQTYAPKVKQLALNWLRSATPEYEYLRWAYEWQLEAELGNPQLLISGPNRAWAVDALVKHYSKEDALEILARSCEAALDANNVARYLETTLLREYLGFHAYQLRSSIFERLLEPQLVLADNPSLARRLQVNPLSLGPDELLILARHAYTQNNQRSIQSIFDEINDRLRVGASGYNEERESLFAYLPNIAALCEQIAPQRIVEFSRKVKRSDWPLQSYCWELRRSKNAKVLRELSRLDLSQREREIVIRHLVLLALEEGLDLTGALPGSEPVTDAFEAIYLYARDATELNIGIAFPSQIVGSPEADILDIRPAMSDWFYQVFFCFLANHLWQYPVGNQDWLGKVNGPSWPIRLLGFLNELAKSIAESLNTETPLSLGDIYRKVQQVEKPSWTEDRRSFDYGIAAERAINQITLDLFVFGAAIGIPQDVSQADLETAFSSGYCNPFVWTENYLTRGRQWLGNDVVQWLLSQLETKVNNTIEVFTERSSNFALMAALAANHNLVEQARHYIQEAASNLLGYGDHKDMLLFGALEVTKSVHSVSADEARRWLLSLVPAISSVTKFTDGDETNNLPEELADVLIVVAPDLLPRYHEWLLQNEQYYYALHAFHVYLRTADLSGEVNQALARTAIDDASVQILVERASVGDNGAKSALASLGEYFGDTFSSVAERAENQTSTLPGLDESTVPNPPDYPPERFPEFLDAAGSHYYFGDSHVRTWLQYWIGANRAEEALAAIEVEVKRGRVFDIYDDLYELAMRLYGREQAYPWLVRAYVRGHGWTRYYTNKEESVHRWHIIRDHFPDHWLKFVQDTLKLEDQLYRTGPSGSSIFQHLVEYFLFMNHPDLARALAERAINFTLETVAPLQLPIPGWIKNDNVAN